MYKSILVMLTFLLLGACTKNQLPKAELPVFASITGSLSYRQRLVLPPEAIVIVQLEDVTVSDKPQILAEQRLERPGQVPIPFDLRYDSRAINPSHQYRVSARILRGPRVLFMDDQNTLVLTQGHPAKVEMILRLEP